MTRRALALGAHPDDVEFMMAGTLALLKQQGWEVCIGIAAKGDGGSKDRCRRDITAIRRAEAEKAAERLGAQLFTMGLDDLDIDVNSRTRRLATEVLRKANPDLVLTNPPVDYMSDHESTSRLVRDACFAASVPNYETGDPCPAPVTDHVPALFYCDPIEGIDLWGQPVRPDFVVDISETIDLKREMLACHASQREWLRAQHGMDQYLIAMEEWAKVCGASAGFPFGEGFRQHLGHAFPRENAIAEALGGKVKRMS